MTRIQLLQVRPTASRNCSVDRKLRDRLQIVLYLRGNPDKQAEAKENIVYRKNS